MVNIRDALNALHALLAIIIATTTDVKQLILAQQVRMAHASNLFDMIHDRSEKTPENTGPWEYADFVDAVARQAAEGDEDAVNVAGDARVKAEDICFTLEGIDEAVQETGGGDHEDLFDRTKACIVSPDVSDIAPAPGTVELYAEVTRDLHEIHERLAGLKAMALEASAKYAEVVRELVAGGDDDDDVDDGIDDRDVVEVKQMYGRCLDELVVLHRVCWGLLFMLMNLSGYYDPPR